MTISECSKTTNNVPGVRHQSIVADWDRESAELIQRLQFYPAESLVARWMARGSEVLVQRVDFNHELDAIDLGTWFVEFIEPARQYHPDHVRLLIFSEVPIQSIREFIRQSACQLNQESIKTESYAVISESGITVQGCVPQCIPHMKPITQSVIPEIARSREELFESFNYVPELGIAHRIKKGALSSLDPQSQVWRLGAVTELVALLTGQAENLTDKDIARYASICTDIRARDTLLWELANQNLDPINSARILSSMLPHLSGKWTAPVATTAGICWWLAGNGAVANMCIDRALAEDAKYSLATLVRAALISGLSPQFWIESVHELTRDDCLNGADGAKSE